MPVARFIHLSDIHFGQGPQGTEPTYADVRDQLLSDGARFHQQIGPATGILVTGDIAFKGDAAEYQSASIWLEDLAKAVGCSLLAVAVIPGNHDVDRRQVNYATQLVHDNLRHVPLDQLDADLSRLNDLDEIRNPLLPKVAAYRQFANQFGCDFDSIRRPIWQKDHHLQGQYRLRFLGLNGVLVSDERDRQGEMVLGNAQYTISVKEPDVEPIVLLHHPLHWFRDSVQAAPFLKRAPVILLGHEHHLGIRRIQEGSHDYLEIHAGAVNPPDHSDVYQYRYNWIEFDLEVIEGEVRLIVTVYPRVWHPDAAEFVPDQNSFRGKICESYSIPCRNFRLSSMYVEPEQVPLAVTTAENDLPKEDSEMIPEASDPMAQLRYLFFRYLDRTERLKILVDLGVLPATASTKLPQTIENQILNVARTQGKLPQLWEAVMSQVPEEKRQANPFK